MSASLLVPVLAASLVGSLHCAGMCGGLAAFCAGSESGTTAARRLVQVAYHLGRLVAYLALGAIAGGLGAALDMTGTLGGFPRLGAVLAGGVMMTWGAFLLARSFGVSLPMLRVPVPLQAALVKIVQPRGSHPGLVRGLLVGLASALLPCGWLYSFAAASAGTGSVLGGAALMFAFWLGTVPVLASLGLGVQALSTPLRKRVPLFSAGILVLLGFASVLGRLNLPASAVSNARRAVTLTSSPEAPPSVPLEPACH
jgi:uncharacterized protein